MGKSIISMLIVGVFGWQLAARITDSHAWGFLGKSCSNRLVPWCRFITVQKKELGYGAK